MRIWVPLLLLDLALWGFVPHADQWQIVTDLADDDDDKSFLRPLKVSEGRGLHYKVFLNRALQQISFGNRRS